MAFVVPLGNSFVLPDAMAKWGEGISFNRNGLRFEIECGDSERKKKYHQMWEAPAHREPCRGVVDVAMFRFPSSTLVSVELSDSSHPRLDFPGQYADKAEAEDQFTLWGKLHKACALAVSSVHKIAY